MVGGSTLGPISDIQLPMLTVDIGVPILAMHSAMETMGAKDQAYMEELVRGFSVIRQLAIVQTNKQINK